MSASLPEELLTRVNICIGLLIAVLAILALLAIFRLVFFCFCRKESVKARPESAKCHMQEHIEQMDAMRRMDTMQRPRSTKNSPGSGSQKASSSDEIRTNPMGNKEAGNERYLSKVKSLEVDLEKGVFEGAHAEMRMKLDEKLARHKGETIGTGYTAPRPTSTNSARVPLPGPGITPAPAPLLTGQVPFGQETPPVAAAKDSLIVGQPASLVAARKESLVNTSKEPTSKLNTARDPQPPPFVPSTARPAVPSMSLATSVGSKRNTAV